MRSAPFGDAAVQQHHVGMLGVDLVELVPDQAMVVEVEPAGEGDLGAGRQQHLGLGPALGGEEVAAVDHGRGQRAVVDHRSCARPPGRMPVWRSNCSAAWSRKNSMLFAALDQRLPFGGEAFEFDRADLRAVLFPLAALLRLLVVVELALDPVGGAVEEVDGRPEQVFEVGFEAGVAQGGDQGVEDVGDGAGDGLGFGQRSRVGFVLEGAVAVELEFGEDVVGRG